MKQLFPAQSYRNLRICVALSGGRDSVALLHFLKLNADDLNITLTALTCEHGIRGEASKADLRFVQSLCADWEIPLTVFQKDVPALARTLRCGLEEAGRVFRYDCFQQILDNNLADVVATAHHLNDYAETILFRLCRGTSLSGLNAFPERDGIIRPLLHTSRSEIDEYVKEHALPYTEDESNTDTAYTRNALRGEVFPALERAVPRASKNMVRFAERAARDDEYLQTVARSAIRTDENGLRFPVDLPLPVLSRACLIAVKHCNVTQDYTEAALTNILSLTESQTGKYVSLATGWKVVKEDGELIFFRPAPPFRPIPFAFGSFSVPPHTLIVGDVPAANALRFDADALPSDCVIRTRQSGDVFTPFGGQRKTLKKYLTDKKIPARIGRTLPLVACGNKILAVCGVEISDDIKCTPETVRTGYLILN